MKIQILWQEMIVVELDIKNCLSDGTSFMFNIQTERNGAGYCYDGYDSNGLLWYTTILKEAFTQTWVAQIQNIFGGTWTYIPEGTILKTGSGA